MPSHPTPPSITTVPQPAAVDRAARTRNYLLMMGIRTICFVLAVVLEGWLRWTCAVLAILLPYVAVVIANAVTPPGVQEAETPAGQRHRHLLER